MDRENCIVWDTSEDAVNAVVMYTQDALDNDGTLIPAMEIERNKIAQAGAKIARDHLTWNTKMLELTAMIDAVRGTR